MPRLGGISPSGVFGTVRNFTNVLKEIDFEEVRGRAETPPAILVAADDHERAASAIRDIFGDDATRWVDIRTEHFGDVLGYRYDLIVVIDPHGQGILPAIDQALADDVGRKLVFVASAEDGLTAEQIQGARARIVTVDPVLAPALGRRFEALRPHSVRAIIDDTARANAQFALVSNVPAVVPIIGGLMAASADLIVLTKNQVMMVYKIAAAHDRDLANQRRILQELAPVVGSGFLWRTIAREAASFLPLAAGTVPKVAIAYVGTVVLGRASDYYYRFGKKPTREHLREFTQRATETVSRLPIGRKEDQESREASVDETDS